MSTKDADISQKNSHDDSSTASSADEEDKSGYDYLFNVIILGDSGVGKTDLIGRLRDENFQTKFQTTMGINVEGHVVPVNGKKVKLKLWDPSGSDRYLHVVQKYFASIDGIIFVYDVSYAKSFRSLNKWIDIANENEGAKLPKILVGNKCDIKRRAVTREQGEQFSLSSGMEFVETSAASGHNVSEIFASISKLMVAHHGEQECNTE